MAQVKRYHSPDGDGPSLLLDGRVVEVTGNNWLVRAAKQDKQDLCKITITVTYCPHNSPSYPGFTVSDYICLTALEEIGTYGTPKTLTSVCSLLPNN